jgi:hypothetical protein
MFTANDLNRRNKRRRLLEKGWTTDWGYAWCPKKNDIPDTQFLVKNFFIYFPEIIFDSDGNPVLDSGEYPEFNSISSFLSAMREESIEFSIFSGNTEWLSVVDYWCRHEDDFYQLLVDSCPGPVEIKGGILYRCWDSSAELLYIGESKSKIERIASHSYDHWWKRVSTITIEHFDTKEEARQAEEFAIKNESPIYNVVHNS